MKKDKKYKVYYEGRFQEEIIATSKLNVNEYIKDNISSDDNYWFGLKFSKFKVEAVNE
jgi:hypothetical protein